MDCILDLMDDDEDDFKLEKCCLSCGFCCGVTSVLVSLLLLFLVGGLSFGARSSPPAAPTFATYPTFGDEFKCDRPCSMKIVESIPTGLHFSSTIKHASTYREWLVRIVQNTPKSIFGNADTVWLQKNGRIDVRTLDLPRLLGGGAVLHSNFIIVDGKHFYLGSASMDWKALTEVKELGIVVRDCECMASDLQKIFDIYWSLAEGGTEVPSFWPTEYWSPYNSEEPNRVVLNSAESKVYFLGSPPALNPYTRENDLDTILRLIHGAHESICISVTDYKPTSIHVNPNGWPVLDDALRDAVYRGVHVKMLLSKWRYTPRGVLDYLKHLARSERNIEIKWFEIPATLEQKRIDRARVNHNQYMVTDSASYIGTVNWMGDYFNNTAGVGLVVSSQDSNSVQEQLQAVFDRDWNSDYAKSLF